MPDFCTKFHQTRALIYESGRHHPGRGDTLVVGFTGGQLFRRFGIPQVVGYIVVGMLLGPSFLDVIPETLNAELNFVSHIDLGLIDFEMGEHLLFANLRK